MLSCVFATVLLVATITASAERINVDKYDDSRGFQPSPNFYRSKADAGDQLAESTDKLDAPSVLDRNDIGVDKANLERTQRFGISSYTGTGSSYPATGSSATGLYNPIKIDLGGVLLGSIIGLGAILVLPKLIHAFSYSYGGGYARNLDADMGQVTEMLAKMDDLLSQYNIDSSSCMQRLTCGYVQSATMNDSHGNGTEVDKLVVALSSNTMTEYMLGGSVLLRAIEKGKNTQTDCQRTFPSCQVDKATLTKIITNLIPT